MTKKKSIPVWLFPAVFFAGVLGLAGFLLFGSDASEAFVYSKLVHEVMASPDVYYDKEVRVEGQLRQGSIRFREKPCEWRFVLEKQNRDMRVAFPQCVVPDTFRDGQGLTVTVQGTLQRDGSFLANQVVPRCPSKYEMEQAQKRGEKAPYEMGKPLEPGSL